MQSNEITEKIEKVREKFHKAFSEKMSPEVILQISQELDVLIAEFYKENAGKIFDNISEGPAVFSYGNKAAI